MTLKTRKILFLISLLIFLIAVPVLVEYAQGLRFDFKTWQFVETGGFFFRVHSPTEIKIYLDDKLVKETSSFSYFNNAFIQNLTPNNYKVKISRDGFQDWEKILNVDSGLVTEAHNIFLLPKNIDLSQFGDQNDKVDNFYISPDNKNIASIGRDELNQLFIKIIDLNSTKEQKYIAPPNLSSLELYDWHIDSGSAIFNNKDKSEFIIVDLINKQIKTLNSQLPKRSVLKDVGGISSISQDILLITEGDTLYGLDISKKLYAPIKENVVSAHALNNLVYFINFDVSAGKYVLSRAYYKNNELIQPEVVGDLNFKISKNPIFNIDIINPELIYIHEKNDGLLVEYSTKDNIRRIDNEISFFSLSSDQKKLLYQKKNEVWVYYTDDIKIQPFKYAGQRELIVKNSQDIISSQWHDTNHHIIYSFDNSIKITELDERSGRNIAHIAELPSPKLLFSNNDDYLYMLTNKSILRGKLE